MKAVRRLLERIGNFRRDVAGVAAVEFALILPMMLLLYVGTVEASALIAMDRRVQTIAGAVGDLVSRSNVNLAACDLKDYFQASAGIMAPYTSNPVQQIVSLVKVDTNGVATVEWSQAAGGATARKKPDPYPLPQAMKNISLNAYVIVSEASYSYAPITTLIYSQPIQLRRENFYSPRFGGSIVINPTSTSACP
ncbi:MAG: TadE/TadG family type IV pilus assembly protein [Devosia sp.]